ncbi:MAG: peptidase U32 family protein [Prevotellaceae bacterium]|nr:peptidase U32 family protein [Prevotellaceae bacterium]
MIDNNYEIMAPVGSRESLAAAINAGADSIYFGIEKLNMRAHSASTFTIEDLREMAATCDAKGIKTYLTVNTIIYGEDIEQMHEIIDAAKEAGISAVIASDVSVMTYCRKVGQEVHLSTQLNISNIEALRFYAQFADVVVLARELRMDQVKAIHEQAVKENICGPSGNPIRIEMFCHGALCMAISGKCYLSLHNAGRSANRGECVQICRRKYDVTDAETGNELLVDNKYIMSPKDLKTIRFIDKMMDAGVRVFKIEGRARGPEYVDTVVRCYREAINAVLHDQEATTVSGNSLPEKFTEQAKDAWDEQLSRVFNRGFWDGYYQGQTLGEWNDSYGSKATEKKVYCAKTIKYFSKIGVAEFQVEAHEIRVGDKLLITGPTTGAMYLDCNEIRFDLKPVQTAKKGWRISIAVPDKVRPSDKLFILEPVKN